MPGGTPAAQGPRVYTSIPTYRTVNPNLKAMLNHMEEEKKPIFNFAIRADQPLDGRILRLRH